MVLTFRKNDESQVSKYFKAHEFDCPCLKCETTLIDSELVLKLDKMREAAGSPLKITSGYRCPDHQAALKAKGYETAPGISQHELGKAADVVCLGVTRTGQDLEKYAVKAGFKRLGVGLAFIHVDVKEGSNRWQYKSN